jgi:hypothetical protein
MALAEEYSDRRVYRPTDETPEPDQAPKGAAGSGTPAPNVGSEPSN